MLFQVVRNLRGTVVGEALLDESGEAGDMWRCLTCPAPVSPHSRITLVRADDFGLYPAVGSGASAAEILDCKDVVRRGSADGEHAVAGTLCGVSDAAERRMMLKLRMPSCQLNPVRYISAVMFYGQAVCPVTIDLFKGLVRDVAYCAGLNIVA